MTRSLDAVGYDLAYSAVKAHVFASGWTVGQITLQLSILLSCARDETQWGAIDALSDFLAPRPREISVIISLTP